MSRTPKGYIVSGWTEGINITPFMVREAAEADNWLHQHSPGCLFSFIIEVGQPQGLNCTCGESHHEGHAYYVSVISGDKVVLAAGPFREHNSALDMVHTVKLAVSQYDTTANQPWYAYGTMAMLPEFITSAKGDGRMNPFLKLNLDDEGWVTEESAAAALGGAWRPVEAEPEAKPRRRRQPKLIDCYTH